IICRGNNEENIYIEWCRGHNDITGNEFADYLAKSGAQSNNRKFVGVPPSYVKKTINDYFYKRWCDRYKD
ncbi:Uncharacterized protein FKW44_022335, partial [Caligus rogercresseyi]